MPQSLLKIIIEVAEKSKLNFGGTDEATGKEIQWAFLNADLFIEELKKHLSE